MGFDGVISSLIIFIAVVSITVVVVTSFKAIADESLSSIETRSNQYNYKLKTEIEITSIKYNSSKNQLYVFVHNIGKTKLKTDYIDIYIDGLFISRDLRKVNVIPSTDLENPGLFDPNEVINITVNKTLSSGEHKVKVVTQYGEYDEDIFSV